MQIVDLEQGTSEWKDFRRQHICASDVAAILGDGYRSAIKVYKEKVFGEEEPENEFMRSGRDREPRARIYINEKMKRDFKPIVCVSDAYPWLMASLDGWDEDTVLEIKCPMRYEKFMEIGLNKAPPAQYLWQIQTQLLVTGADHAFLCYYVDDPIVDEPESVEILVLSDMVMQGRIVSETKMFWYDNVLEWKEPENKRKPKKESAGDSLFDRRTA